MKNAFDNYQKESRKTAVYPFMGEGNLIYPALGLAGEAGETVDKIKKYWRNLGKFPTVESLDQGQKEAIILELGDILWYIAALATEIHCPLSSIAEINLQKLQDRAKRNVIKSEGDNR